MSSVQTRLANSITKRLNKEFKTNINANQISIKYNGMVNVRDVLILDHRQDTLINAKQIQTSLLNVGTIFNNNLSFGAVDFKTVVFNIKTYKGETESGLDLFVKRFDSDTSKKSKNKFVLTSNNVVINDGVFRIINENLESKDVLELSNISLNVDDFLINGSDVSLSANKLSFKEARGLVVENFTTNFKYTPCKMSFDALRLATKHSKLQGNLQFDYTREDLKQFFDKVKVSGSFKKSKILLDELNVYYNEFGKKQLITFNTLVRGTLNNLVAKQLRLKSNGYTKIYGDVGFQNLFNKADNNFVMNGRFSKLASNYSSLKALLPNVLGDAIPKLFQNIGNFNIVGSTKITSSAVRANFEMETPLGFVKSNLKLNKINDIEEASYKGNIILDDFDLGALINDKKLRGTSLNLDVDGSGFNKENITTKIKGSIYDLVYNDYMYKNFEAEGQLRQNVFNGKLVTNDPNLKLEFNGLADLSSRLNFFDFVADVKYANLKALNFYKKDAVSEFIGVVDMKMKGTSVDDAVGDILFRNTLYTNQDDVYKFKDFFVKSYFKNNERFLKINSPDIIEGDLSGHFKLKTIPKLFKNAILSTYANTASVITKEDENQYIDFNFKIYNKIVEVFYPKITLGKNTFIKGRVESDEKEFKLTFKSPKIKLLDYLVDNIELEIDNKNPLFNTYLQVDTLNLGNYAVSKFNLINVSLNDTLYMRSEFSGGKKQNDKYELSFYHTKNENSNSVIGFKESVLEFKNNKWVINADKDNLNKIEFSSDFKNFIIQPLKITHKDALIYLSGSVSDSLSHKDLKLDFKNVDLQKVTPDIDNLALQGQLNGTINVLGNNKGYTPNSKLTIDKLKLNQYLLGDFLATIKGSNYLKSFNVDAKLAHKGKIPLSVKGNVNVENNVPDLNLDVTLKQLSLKPLNSFLEGVLSNVRGDVFGKVSVNGSYKEPSYNGQLIVNNGGLGVPYLNVDYAFQDMASVSVTTKKFNFNNVKIKDTAYNSTGRLNGYLMHDYFSKWNLDLDINSDKLLVLDTKETKESLYYGTGFIGGNAKLYGPAEALRINVVAQTESGTVFKIPLSDTETFSEVSYINFISKKDKKEKKTKGAKTDNTIKGLQLNFDLDINENAEIEIVIDKESGSNIIGRGVGGLLAEINTNGKFNMYGDFSVFSGVYNFLYGGLIEKQFTVEPGGALAWDGDPYNARMNIKAFYKTRANPSPLLDEPINTAIPVDLAIHLTGQLELPEIDFNFDFPNLSSTIKSEIAYRLESKEDRQNQALYMLSTGAFSQGLNDLNFAGTLTERFNGLINGILSNNDNKLNVGLNYEAGQNRPDYQTNDRLGVTLQTQISDRILINGKVGVPIGGVSESVVAGDVQIDFLLNEEGTLTAKVFNRENSIRNFGEEIGYTQGVGVAYNVDFDTFGDLLRKIFKNNPKSKVKKRIQ